MTVLRPLFALSLCSIALMACDLDGKVRHRDGPQAIHPGDVVRAANSAAFSAQAGAQLSAAALAEATLTTDQKPTRSLAPAIQ